MKKNIYLYILLNARVCTYICADNQAASRVSSGFAGEYRMIFGRIFMIAVHRQKTKATTAKPIPTFRKLPAGNGAPLIVLPAPEFFLCPERRPT